MLTTGIRFRGKCKETDVWVYGHLFSDEGKAYIIDTMSEDTQAKEYSEVYPETVGQHTGVYDKKGVGIYEGDIVTLELPAMFEGEGTRGVVRKLEGAYVLDNGSTADYLFSELAVIHIIGNIHDNPELLGDIKQ